MYIIAKELQKHEWTRYRTRVKTFKKVTRCRDSRSAKSVETR